MIISGKGVKSMDDRLTELEMRFMHQARILEELNDLVYQQQQTVVRLEKEMKQIREQMRNVMPSAAIAENEPPPPHY
jgi:SlyX protein